MKHFSKSLFKYLAACSIFAGASMFLYSQTEEEDRDGSLPRPELDDAPYPRDIEPMREFSDAPEVLDEAGQKLPVGVRPPIENELPADVQSEAQGGSQSSGLEQSSGTSQVAAPLPEKKIEPTYKERIFARLNARSPFGDVEGGVRGVSGGAQGAQSSSAQAPEGMTLTSIYCVDGKWFFVVNDSDSKKTYTMKLGLRGTDDPFGVEFFDDETNSVSVSSDLGTYTLTLKERDPLTAPVPNMVAAVKSASGTPKRLTREQIRGMTREQRIEYFRQFRRANAQVIQGRNSTQVRAAR